MEWIDDKFNAEQKTAIQNIVMKTSSPFPFILFGPPGKLNIPMEFRKQYIKRNYNKLGTGKTKTLVEAIAQIATTTTQKVLVCATSNAACDVLASRLLKIIPESLIYRMYSTTTSLANVEQHIKESSNAADGDAFYPSIEHLKYAQVLICTLVVAGRLMQAKITKRYPNHFSYIFIDECACSTESASIIPIIGRHFRLMNN